MTESATEIPNKTDEELKQLAKDLHLGKIFCSLHCNNFEEIRLVFLPLALMSGEQAKPLADRNVDFVYEYLDKAGPRSVNGFPQFMSFQFLLPEDARKVVNYYELVKSSMDNCLANG